MAQPAQTTRPSSKAKILFTGQTHTSVKHAAANVSDHGTVDIRMSSPDGTGMALEDVVAHPTAEQLFAGAWSACYITAVQLCAQQMKVKLPADLAVDIEIDVAMKGVEWVLQAGFNVRVPGLEQAVAEKLVHTAHELCPYSKATHGNIDVTSNVTVS